MRCSYAGHRSSTYLKRIMETFKSSDTIGYACTIQEKYFTRLRWLIARLHALVRLTTRVSWMVNSDGWDVISSIVHLASCFLEGEGLPTRMTSRTVLLSVPTMLFYRGGGVAHQNDVTTFLWSVMTMLFFRGGGVAHQNDIEEPSGISTDDAAWVLTATFIIFTMQSGAYTHRSIFCVCYNASRKKHR